MIEEKTCRHTGDRARGGRKAEAPSEKCSQPVGRDELAVSRARQRNVQGWQRPGKKADED